MSFIAAHLEGSNVPPQKVLPLAASQSGETGALMLQDSNGAMAECGADPASIGAVSEGPFGSDTSGFNHFAVKNFPPGYISVTPIIRNRTFRARYVGTLPAADGGSYGVVRDTDGKWKVDFAETTATRLKLVGRLTTSPQNIPEVLVTFLTANIQILV